MMWTAAEALAFIRMIHPAAFDAGWNLHLGGSLATGSGESDSDADVLAMPRFQTREHDRVRLLSHLKVIGWKLEGASSALPHREVWRLVSSSDKVIDLIFVILP